MSPMIGSSVETPRRVPHGAAGVFSFALACATPPGGVEPGEVPVAAPGVEAMVCEEAPPRALALADAEPCGWALTDGEGGGVEVRMTSAGGPRARGEAPSGCAHGRCAWDLVVVDGAPFALATREGAASEVPEGRWLGVLDGERLVFVDLWWGEGSFGDSTDMGPVYALAPWICGGRVVLRTQARLPEAAVEAAPPGLVARAGLIEASGGEVKRVGEDPGGACVPLLAR